MNINLFKISLVLNAVLFLLLIGLFLQFFKPATKTPSKIEEQAGTLQINREILKSLHQKLAEKGVVSVEPEVVLDVWGRIESLEKSLDQKQPSKIILTVKQPFDPLNYLFPQEQLEILITEGTKIIFLKPADHQAVEKLMFEYDKAVREGRTPPAFASPWTEEIITFDDLRVGDQVKVYSKENIKFKSSFTAVKIEKKQTENIF